MNRTLIGTLVFAATISGGAWAQSSMDKPQLKVGDRWVYRLIDLWKNEETVTVDNRVTGVVGNNIEAESTIISAKTATNDGTPSTRTLKHDASRWNFIDVRIREGQRVDFAFPLAVGKTWEYEFRRNALGSSDDVVYKLKSKVEGWEDVSVPAGTFKTLKVVHSGYWIRESVGGAYSSTVTETFWSSPEVKRPVKSEYYLRSSNGQISVQIRKELTEVQAQK